MFTLAGTFRTGLLTGIIGDEVEIFLSLGAIRGVLEVRVSTAGGWQIGGWRVLTSLPKPGLAKTL